MSSFYDSIFSIPSLLSSSTTIRFTRKTLEVAEDREDSILFQLVDGNTSDPNQNNNNNDDNNNSEPSSSDSGPEADEDEDEEDEDEDFDDEMESMERFQL